MKTNDKFIRGKGVNFCTGYGNVLHINNINEFGLVKKGDVVVTKNASPDFILILKRIACIITDEGGITSHIAIVCRELSVPAIVGTGNATKLFKNGDIVFFDSKEGIAYVKPKPKKN